MSANVHDQLSGQHSALVRKMTRNSQVTSAVMGFLNVLCGLAVTRGYPVGGLRIGEISVWPGEVWRAKLSWSHVVMTLRPAFLGAKNDFYEYTKAKAVHMAAMVKANPEIERFFEHMVGALDAWCRTKGCMFEDVEIVDPIVTKDCASLQFKVKRGDLILA